MTRAAAVINGQADPLRPASEVHAQVPKALARVLSQAMRQDAGGRWQTAAEMRAGLRAAQEHLESGEPDVEDPRLFAPVFFEQETRRFDEHAGSRSPEATNNLPAQQTIPMGVGRDAALKADTGASQREAYVTKLMAPAPVVGKPPAYRKPAVAASVAALLLAAVVTAMNFTGNSVPNAQDERTESQLSNTAQANTAQSDLAQAAVAPAANPFAQETKARDSSGTSAPAAVATGRQARTGAPGVGANRPATRKPAPAEKNQRQRNAPQASVYGQGFEGEFDFRRMQIDLSGLDKAIAEAPNAAERVKMEKLRKKWMDTNKLRVQQKEHNRFMVVPPLPPETLERPRQKPYKEPTHGNRKGAPASPQFQSAAPIIRASSSDSRRAQTRASSPGSTRTVCSG